MRSPIKSQIGKRRSIFPPSLNAFAISAPRSSRGIADVSAPLREIHAPPIVLYVWGELTERDHHAIGVIGSRRTSHYGAECAKKALLSARLCRAHRHQRTGARDRYRRASGRARRERPHDRRDRFRTERSFIRRRTLRWRKKFAAETAQSCPSSRWRSNQTARPFRCATASLAAGVTAFWSSKPD